MRPTGSPEELERRRLRALALLKEGLLPVEVARRVGADRRSVRRWKRAARRRGEAGIRAKPASGRPPKLGVEHKRRLEALLLDGAQAAGFHTDLWTCPRVAEIIERRFGVHYHVDHIGRLLHDLDWSPQKPERRALEHDKRAILGWVRERWPRVKKTLPAGARRSSSSTKRGS
jgi:transposase